MASDCLHRLTTSSSSSQGSVSGTGSDIGAKALDTHPNNKVVLNDESDENDFATQRITESLASLVKVEDGKTVYAGASLQEIIKRLNINEYHTIDNLLDRLDSFGSVKIVSDKSSKEKLDVIMTTLYEQLGKLELSGEVKRGKEQTLQDIIKGMNPLIREREFEQLKEAKRRFRERPSLPY